MKEIMAKTYVLTKKVSGGEFTSEKDRMFSFENILGFFNCPKLAKQKIYQDMIGGDFVTQEQYKEWEKFLKKDDENIFVVQNIHTKTEYQIKEEFVGFYVYLNEQIGV